MATKLSVSMSVTDNSRHDRWLTSSNDSLHGAYTHTRQLCCFVDAVAGCPQCANARLGRSVKFWSAQGFTLCAGACQPSVDSFDDDGALELGEHPAHTEHRFARGCRGIDILLMQIQANPLLLEFLHELHQMLQAAADAVDRPRGNHVELASGSGLRKSLERRAFLAALGAADAVIDVLLDDLPAALLGNPQKFLALVLDCLAGGGDPEVNPDSFRLAHDNALSRWCVRESCASDIPKTIDFGATHHPHTSV